MTKQRYAQQLLSVAGAASSATGAELQSIVNRALPLAQQISKLQPRNPRSSSPIRYSTYWYPGALFCARE